MAMTDGDINRKQEHEKEDALLISMFSWHKHLFKPYFWRSLAILVVGFMVTWGSSIPPAIALAPLSLPGSPLIADTAAPLSTLDSTLDQFLQNIPPGYYGIRDVNLLKTRLKATDMVLVDVREPSEYLVGHIDGAINIPLRTLAQNLDRIPKDKEVVLYCSSGYRTGMGVMTLHLLGYDNVQGFPPSYKGWQQAEQ
jgi:rhodanese-related sulfurtransferase